MGQEASVEQKAHYELFKQNVFASAFGSLDQQAVLKQYYEIFEKEEEQAEFDYEVEEFEPENEQDVMEMLNAARRAGAVR